MTNSEINMLKENIATNVRECERVLYLMEITGKEISKLENFENTSNRLYELKRANAKFNRLRTLKTKLDKEWFALMEEIIKH